MMRNGFRYISLVCLCLFAVRTASLAQTNWNSVLDRYESITAQCKALRDKAAAGEPVSQKSVTTLFGELGRLRNMLQQSSGKMSKAQRDRFERIRRSYDGSVPAGEPAEPPALRQAQGPEVESLTRRQTWILIVLLLTVVALIVGVTCFEWYMPEITGLFLAMGITCAIIAGFDSDRAVKELMAGAKDILSAALVVGFASGIIVILQDGKVVDSVLHAMQEGLEEGGKLGSLSAMYGIQSVINFIIPSATAKAAITIPIMAPFADMTGVSRQAMVLAFQFGDGFTNMITPTSGVLVAALAMARIPYSKWVRWIWKMVLALLVIGLLLLLPTALFQIAGF